MCQIYSVNKYTIGWVGPVRGVYRCTVSVITGVMQTYVLNTEQYNATSLICNAIICTLHCYYIIWIAAIVQQMNWRNYSELELCINTCTSDDLIYRKYRYVVFDIDISYCIVSSKTIPNFLIYRDIQKYCDIFDSIATFSTNFSVHCVTGKKITNEVS